MFLYRDILSRTWTNTWRNKYLWFFGLFAALLGGWGDLEIVFRGFNNSAPGAFYGFESLSATIFSKEIFADFHALAAPQGYLGLIISLLVLFMIMLIGFFLLWLTVVSQAALITNATRIATGKKHALGTGAEAGAKKFWPVLCLNVLLKTVTYGILSLYALFVFSGTGNGDTVSVSVFSVLAFVIFIPAAVILSFITKYAICYTVIKGEKLINAVKLGWGLFLKNWLISLEMAFILFFITFVYALSLLMLFLILSVPFLFYRSRAGQNLLDKFMASGRLGPGPVFFRIIILSGAIVATFQISAWTALFLELISRGGFSKLARLFGKNK